MDCRPLQIIYYQLNQSFVLGNSRRALDIPDQHENLRRMMYNLPHVSIATPTSPLPPSSSKSASTPRCLCLDLFSRYLKYISNTDQNQHINRSNRITRKQVFPRFFHAPWDTVCLTVLGIQPAGIRLRAGNTRRHVQSTPLYS